MRTFIENGFEITEYENGTIVKKAISEGNASVENNNERSIAEKIDDIEVALDLLLLKQEGVIS